MWKILVIQADGSCIAGNCSNRETAFVLHRFARVCGLNATLYGPEGIIRADV